MSSEKIRIIHMDEDLVVVNKPASIPVRKMFFGKKTNGESNGVSKMFIKLGIVEASFMPS